MTEDTDHLWRADCRHCQRTHHVTEARLRQVYPEMNRDFDSGKVFCHCPTCQGVILLSRTTSPVLDFSSWDYRVPEGFCPECGVQHAEALPHDPTTMVFIANFRQKCIEVGVEPRWPTWRDAMRHCTPQVQDNWTKALEQKGVKDLDAPTT